MSEPFSPSWSPSPSLCIVPRVVLFNAAHCLDRLHYKCSHNRCRKQDSGLADIGHRIEEGETHTINADTVYSPHVLCDGGSDWNLFRTRNPKRKDLEGLALSRVHFEMFI